jgi:hypothetical protein
MIIEEEFIIDGIVRESMVSHLRGIEMPWRGVPC